MKRVLSGITADVAVFIVAASCGGIVVAATPLGARRTIDVQDLRRHVSFLASDTLEGRAAGTQGGQAAAGYLAAEFRTLGLTPAGEAGDFLQEFGRGYRNVLGLLPGSDPELSKQVILLGGHFDHVGYGRPGNSFGPFGQIHNGADDNASGAAAILEVAQACAQLDQRPARSILFALWDAEEDGMLGSEHWIVDPTLAVSQVKLVLNIDMIGRLRNDRVTVYGARTAAGLRQLASLSNRDTRLSLDFDATQRQDSDHWTFYRRRIPYLMFHTGDHDDYHRPSDDAHKLNYDGLEQLARLIFETTQAAANRAALAEFRGDVVRERPESSREVNRPSPPRLGISWNMDRDSSEPFTITRVIADSPAALAGLVAGDRIVGVNGHPAAEIDDLVGAVLAAPETVILLVEKEGDAAPREVSVTLRGIPVRLGINWRSDTAEPDSVIVTAVVPGSPAASAGIAVGDRLSSFDQSAVPPGEWIQSATAAHERLVMLVERNGVVQDVVVDLLPASRDQSPQLAD